MAHPSHYDQGDAASPGDYAWLAGILVLALVLRAVDLNTSLWFDEVITLVQFVRLPVAEVVQTYHSLNNHILFTLQAKAAVALFGEHPWALRLPAMLLGLASIWALWRLGMEVAGRWPARMAALLMAVSYHHVWFSQNARGYTGLVFFGLVATWLLVRAIRKPSLGLWLGYGACLTLAMYTHLSAVFLFAAHGLAYGVLMLQRIIVARRQPLLPVVQPLIGCGAGIAATLLLYAPIIGQMVTAFSEVKAGPEDAVHSASIAEWQSPVWMLQEVASSFGAFGWLGMVLGPAVLAVLVIGGGGLMRRGAVVPLALLIHVPLTVLILFALGFRVWPRYFVIDIGVICLLLSVGAFTIGGWITALLPDWRLLQAGRAGLILAGLGVAASLMLLPKNYMAPKQDYAGVRDYIAASRAPDAVVMTVGLGSLPFQSYYAPDWSRVDSLAEFRAVDDPEKEAWLVYTFPPVVERRHADIFAAAAPRFGKDRYFPGTLANGGIVVLRAAPADGG